jgi:hypothetical protein
MYTEIWNLDWSNRSGSYTSIAHWNDGQLFDEVSTNQVVPTACLRCNTKVGSMTQTSTRIVAALKTPPGRSALFKVVTGRSITTVNPKG